jgi:hypothetical protein
MQQNQLFALGSSFWIPNMYLQNKYAYLFIINCLYIFFSKDQSRWCWWCIQLSHLSTTIGKGSHRLWQTPNVFGFICLLRLLNVTTVPVGRAGVAGNIVRPARLSDRTILLRLNRPVGYRGHRHTLEPSTRHSCMRKVPWGIQDRPSGPAPIKSGRLSLPLYKNCFPGTTTYSIQTEFDTRRNSPGPGNMVRSVITKCTLKIQNKFMTNTMYFILYLHKETKVPDPGSTGWYPLRKTSHNTLVFYMYQLYTVFFLLTYFPNIRPSMFSRIHHTLRLKHAVCTWH